MEVGARVEHFLFKVFNYFYIVIWFYMKLEDGLEVFPMFIPQNFLEQFVFIWGCKQCSKTFVAISSGSHYYLKDLKQMYYACHGLPYGREDQTLQIDKEPIKRIRIQSGMVFFFKIIQGIDVVKKQGAMVGLHIMFVAALA
jgi:hypothetical protein